MIIPIPGELTTQDAFKLCDSILNETDYSESYEFDLSNLKFVESGAGLILMNCINKLMLFHSNSKFTITMSDSPGCKYLKRMGILEKLGDYNLIAEELHAQGNGNFIPLNFFTRDQIVSQPGFVSIGDSLDEIAKEMSQNLTRGQDKQLSQMLQFCLREIMRNVFEHSNSDELGYCAQYYPKLDKVELTIFDTGIGILKGLSTNPFAQKITTDRDAVCTALLPGVSGKTFKGVKKTNDPWQNSGFGLYMMRKIAEKAGALMIFSNTAGVRIVEDGIDHFNGWHKGTVVNLVIKPSKIGNVKTLLADFSREGSIVARTLRGAEYTPSTASQMLSEDIKRLQNKK